MVSGEESQAVIEVPQLGVLVMDDGRDFGEVLTARLSQLRPTSVRLAVEGAPERPGLRTIAVVPPEKFTVRTAVELAAQEGLFWIVAPRRVEDPLSAFTGAARAAAGVLDEQHPGFAVAFAEADWAGRKVAVVADINDPVTTGITAWAGVGAALVLGASLDFLVLGAPEGEDPPADWRAGMSRFRLQGNSEHLVATALERAEAHGIAMHWRPLGSPIEKANAILRVISEGGYDFVIDDLPPINVGPRVGRKRRVQAALSQAGSNATAYRLLRDAPCGVVVVFDAIRMGMIPSDVLRAAGVAALTLGIVGGATLAAGPAAATMVATETTSTDDAIAQAQAEAEAFDPTGMDEADLAAIEQERDAANAQVAATQQELAAEQAQAAEVDKQLSSTQAQIDQLTPQVEQAEAVAADAEMKAGVANLLTRGPMAMVPGGMTAEDAQAARAAADAAKAEAEALSAQLAALQENQTQLTQQAAELDTQMAQTQQQLQVDQQNAATLTTEADELAFYLHPVVIPTEAGWSISGTFHESGGNWSSGSHTGLDFAQPHGADVYAAMDGVVVQAGWGGAYGNTIVIEHADGTRTMYAHLSSSNVTVGQTVAAGEKIGEVGTTGNSTGPHLHFEVILPDGTQIDPAPWLGL